MSAVASPSLVRARQRLIALESLSGFGETVDALCAAHDLTHYRLGQRAGLSFGHVSRVIRGERIPGRDTVERIANVFPDPHDRARVWVASGMLPEGLSNDELACLCDQLAVALLTSRSA